MRSAQTKAFEAATAFLVWQGISHIPWTRSQTEPIVFWNAMAAASAAWAGEPLANSTTAAAAIAPAAPIST